MIYAETAACVLIAANIIIWGSLSARVRRFFRRVPAPPFVQPHTGRHVARQPRHDAPLTEQVIEVTQTSDRPPWAITTAANPVLNDDAETLRLGGWGVVPQLEAALADRLAEAYLP